jgi:hypothetical protein
MASRVINMREFLRFAEMRTFLFVTIKRDATLDANRADWMERARESVEGLWFPAAAGAIEFDGRLIAAQRAVDPEATELYRLNPFFAMHWDDEFAIDAAGAFAAWPRSVDWVYRPLPIRFFLLAPVEWVLREWHELLAFMVERQRGLRELHAQQLAMRNPILRRRTLHVWGVESTVRTRPLRRKHHFLSDGDSTPDSPAAPFDGFLRDLVHYSSVLEAYSELEGGLRFDQERNRALAQARLWGNAQPSDHRCGACIRLLHRVFEFYGAGEGVLLSLPATEAGSDGALLDLFVDSFCGELPFWFAVSFDGDMAPGVRLPYSLDFGPDVVYDLEIICRTLPFPTMTDPAEPPLPA